MSLAIIILLFVSFLGGVLFFLSILITSQKVRIVHVLISSYIFGVIAFSQVSTPTTSDFDIIRYYSLYDLFSNLSPREAFSVIFITGDWLFYSFEFLISCFFPNDPRFLSFFCTFTTVLLISYSLINLKSTIDTSIEIKDKSITGITYFVFLLSFMLMVSLLNFTNVLRQYLAIATIIYLMSIYSKTNVLSRCLLSIAACLTHWSSITLLIPFFVFKYIRRKTIIMGILLGSFLLGFIGFPIVLSNISLLGSYLGGSEILGLDRSFQAIALFSALLLLYFILNRKDTDHLFYFISSLIFNIFIFSSFSSVLFRLGLIMTILITVLFTLYSMLNYQGKQIALTRTIFIILLTLNSLYNINSLARSYSNMHYEIFTTKYLLSPGIEIFSSEFDREMIE